jgi:hypothetical protein
MSRAALPALVLVTIVTMMMSLVPVRSTHASEASAGRSGAFAIDATFVLGGQGADYASTISALSRCPGCTESNPIFRNPTQLAAGKILVSSGVLYACHRLRKDGHGRAARVVAIVFGGVGVGMAIHNMRQGRGR